MAAADKAGSSSIDGRPMRKATIERILEVPLEGEAMAAESCPELIPLEYHTRITSLFTVDSKDVSIAVVSCEDGCTYFLDIMESIDDVLSYEEGDIFVDPAKKVLQLHSISPLLHRIYRLLFFVYPCTYIIGISS